jgi:hypothetical protein
MRIRPSLLLPAACLALLGGCELFYGVGKFTGLIQPPKFVLRPDAIPEDFKLAVDVHDVAEPATDYVFTFERSGKSVYEVTIRKPARKAASGKFEVAEDQIRTLWKAISEARFDELPLRFPDEGDGPDKADGVQKYYVFADGTERRVETHFQKNPNLELIRKAVVSVVPPDVMTASHSPNQAPPRPKEYVGDVTTKLFHLPGCPRLKDVSANDRRPFGDKFQAYDYQFQPCPECKPDKTR